MASVNGRKTKRGPKAAASQKAKLTAGEATTLARSGYSLTTSIASPRSGQSAWGALIGPRLSGYSSSFFLNPCYLG